MLDSTPATAAGVSAWLHHAAQVRPDARAYTFLGDGESESAVLTYRQLADRVRTIAAHLAASGRTGQPALLVYPPGLDFIVALLACLESGTVAVPVAVPRARRDDAVLERLVRETGATTVLAPPALRSRLGAAIPGVIWDDLAAIEAAGVAFEVEWPQAWSDETPAILQYTSGSTGEPKGVVITHGNLAANEASISAVMGHAYGLVGVGWLPHFHDMGLVGNVLQTLSLGGHLVLMPPAAMVQSPLRWLRAISHYRATTSGGPNFAYDWCVQKIRPEQRAGLDLSHWRVAFVGAEPVHAATLDRFAAAFAPCGFRRDAWLPCYGLAEATLMVTGARGARETTVDGASLQAGRWVPCPATAPGAKRVVSCGPAAPTVTVVLRSTATGAMASAGEIGEILVSGPAVASGYWRNPTATAERFEATLPGQPGRFLATGDLGVLTPDGLHVLGRRREMIIVRGQNLFPADLEFTAQSADAAVTPAGVAVFGIEVETTEAVVVVAEIQRSALAQLQPAATAQAIARAVAEAHGVGVHEVVLVRPGVLQRTTSGKVQRGANRDAYVNGALETHFRMQVGNAPSPALDPAALTRAQLLAAPAGRRARLIVARLKAQVARLHGCDPLELEADQNLLELGLDSMQLLEVKVGLDELAGKELPLDAFLDAGSLAGLAERVLALGGFETPTAVPTATVPAVSIAVAPTACPFGHQAAKPAEPATSPVPAPLSGRRAPGPTPAEIEAEMAQLTRDFPGYLLELTRRHGEIVRLTLGQQEIHLITHPEDLATVLVSQPETWLRRGVWAPFRPVMGGHGLITSEGSAWRTERTFAQPQFNRGAIAGDRATIDATVARALATWPDHHPLSLLTAAKRLTLEIILAKLFGPIVPAAEREELYGAVCDIDRLWNVPAFFLYAGRGGAKLADEHQREVARRVAVIDHWINRWLDQLQAGPADAAGLMLHYRRQGKEVSRQELRDVAVTYLLTGFDTTASGIYWTVCLLLENSEVWARLDTELAAMPPGVESPLTLAVTQEALRLYPPVWYLGREAAVDTNLRGCAIPAGSFAIASPYVVHRNPWSWPDPLAFRPERFLPGAPALPAKAYLPFGLGARMCIGLHFALAEITSTVGQLVRGYRVERVDGEWRGLNSDFTLTPRAPLQVRVAPKAAR